MIRTIQIDDEVSACPFCLGSAKVCAVRDGHQVKCMCGAAGPPMYHGPEGWEACRVSAITAWNRRAATPPAQVADEGEATYPTWIIVNRPGFVPDRKGPCIEKTHTEAMLRELYALYPDCTCTVIAMPSDCYPDSGIEWLAMHGDQRKKRVGAKPKDEGDARDAGRLAGHLNFLASHFQWWLDWDAKNWRDDGREPPEDAHVMLSNGYTNAPPAWPTRTQLDAWIALLHEAQSAIDAAVREGE